MTQKSIKPIFRGLKNLKKTIFNVLEANLDENLIFEKKKTSQNLPSNTEISDIFEICLVAGNGRWPAKNRPEGEV